MDAPSVGTTRARPVPPPGFVLGTAVLAMSWAGPLVRFSDASALAIAAWRLLFSVAFIAVVVAVRFRGRALPRPTARDVGLAVAAGTLLAAHFWSWIASLELTTVASSVVLVSTQPIFVGVLSVALLDERPDRREWTAIIIAVLGAAVIGWGDFGRGRAPLVGDALALAGAVFVSGYYVIGRSLRQRFDLWLYIAMVYGVAAVVLALAVVAAPGAALTGHAPREWLVFLALAAGPMMLGHTGINYALRYIRAYVVNLVVLAEPIGATLIAWLLPAIAEAPPASTVAGGALILGGVALGVRRRTPRD